MQEHVELEVSLEIIMDDIAQEMFALNNDMNRKNDKLKELIALQENAYKGDRKAVKAILA